MDHGNDGGPFDLTILGGRVMDPETMFDGIANVGIKGGTIAAITDQPIEGSEIIDATGLVVAPGFIDGHYHGLDPLCIRMSARDGVTTAMDLEFGAYGISDWYAGKAGQWPLNYGTTVSHEFARVSVHDPEVPLASPADSTGAFIARGEAAKDGVIGWSETRSSRAQLNRISEVLDKGLREGAIGVGATLGYARTGTTTYEMFEVQRAAARYGRLTSVHSRFHGENAPPTEGPLGFDELLANAAALGAPLLYDHNTQYGWWEIEEKCALARARGMNVWSEYYPYSAGSTSIGSEFLRPEGLARAGLTYEDIYDPSTDSRLTEEEYWRIVADDPGRTIVVFVPAAEAWVPHWLRIPHMVVASDAMWKTGSTWDEPLEGFEGHPRASGTHGRVLRMAREHGVPLMFTMSQMSYWSAKHLGDTGLESMKVRGRLQVGMVADITVFNAGTVTDNSTFKPGEQGLPTTGIDHVIVNGQPVVHRGEFVHGVWAGQPIRFPEEQRSRHVPVTAEQFPL